MLTNRRTITVEFGECDPSGIVYNPHFFIWFDLSVHALFARGGVDLKTFIPEFGINGIPVVDYKCKFLAPARWGDQLTIETSVTALHRCAFDMQHRVFNGDVLAAECTETRVCTAHDAQLGRTRAFPLPDKLVAAFSEKKP